MPACDNFSARLQHHYLTLCFSLFRTHKRKKKFQIGDKVCCTKNGYVTDKDKEDEAKSKKDDLDEGKCFKKDRLCNGEIFFITQVLSKIPLRNHLHFKRNM